MDTYQCRVCGGPLTAQEDAATAVCEYCGSVLRIPRIDPAVYNHALELRRQKKYDQAAALFRQCIRECPQDAEAHWNLLLCKFGIEYVRERDGSRVPTCNALIYDPITEDEDYLDALRFADDMSARLYIDEARRLQAIQTQIVRMARQADYDVFISYKETDEQGGRTEDSVIAQTLYDTLIRKGYKVFLSRVTLKGQAGLEYEPVIFSALNSAPVLLVVGTSRAHLESVWVSNEWKRFLHLMESDKDKKLEVIYKGMKRVDLPAQLRFVPQRDLTSIGQYGWQQDIAYDVESMLGPRRKAGQQDLVIRETDEEAAQREIRNCYIQADHALEQNQQADALRYLDRALDLDDKRLETWWRMYRILATKHKSPTARRPAPPEEAKRAAEKVIAYAGDDGAKADEAQRYLQAWREAYGAACYETLQKLLSGEERYSHRMRKEIEAEYGHVTQYAPPAVRTKAQKAYRIWEQQIPQWEAFCRDTQSADKVFADLRAAHPSLDEAVRKLEAGNKKYRRLNGKALPVGFSTIPTLLYLALSPLLLTIFGPDCLGKDLLGVFSMGSVILLGAYAVGFLAVSFMHNEENSFANCHLLNGGIMGLSVAVGLVLSLFNQIFFRLLASIYEVELVMTKFGEIADGSMVTLLGEFRGFTAVFVKAVVLLTAMAAAGAVVCHGRQRKVESLRKEREKLLLTAQAETRRRVADFCQPYIQAFEYPVAEIFGLRRRVLDYFTRTYDRK